MADLMGVGYLASPPLGGSCTASLIADRVILTAAHCIWPVGTGCPGTLAPPQDIYVWFPDEYGDPQGPNKQQIRAVAFAMHPDAWGGRVTACGNPSPPLTACPAAVGSLAPSCDLVRFCGEDVRNKGFHIEHDLAVGYLEHAPQGITPIPVIVGTATPGLLGNMPVFPGLEPFLGTNPIVTVVGLGGGSTNWCPPLPSYCPGRDFGTARVTGIRLDLPRSDGCSGAQTMDADQPMLTVSATTHEESYSNKGDSGSPVLVGRGEVLEGMETPSDIPSNSGLEQRRYIVGVDSTAGTALVLGASCSPLAHCGQNEACVGQDAQTGWGWCATLCAANADCPDDALCDKDSSGYCVRPFAQYAPTYAEGNGLWLARAIDDIDGDGVPNANDNCVGVPNNQDNCNLDAELDRQGDVLGDACDPIPCPQAEAPVSTEVVISSFEVSCGGTQRSRVLRAAIAPDPIGSQNQFDGSAMSQPGRQAAFRFCQIDLLLGSRCNLGSNQRQDQDFDGADSITRQWHEVELPALGGVGATTTYDFPSNLAPAALAWNYWSDRARWIANGWITDPGTPQKPAWAIDRTWKESSGLDGAFGLRAGLTRSRDLLGTVSATANGVHYTPDLNDGYQTGEGLGRHYIDSMAPDKIVTRSRNKCVAGCVGAVCPIQELLPLRWCPMCERSLDWWNGVDPVDSLLARAQDGRWGLVDNRNRILVEEGLVDERMVQSLESSELSLVPAAEPFLGMGRGFVGVQGVFLAKDGTSIEGRVVGTKTGFRIGGEERDPSVSATQLPSQAFGLTPRSDFTAVLSRSLGALVVAGGRDVSTHALTHQIWLLPEWGLPIQLHTPGYVPQTVLAATVSSADLMLWILDEYKVGPKLVARLVRIDPLSGAFEVVWNGPRMRAFERHWLANDRDGQVLLFGSSSRMNHHVTVRFEAQPHVLGSALPKLFRFDVGELLGQPLVDAAGYQYVSRQGKQRLRSERIERLDDHPGLVVDLSQCL